MRWLLVVVAAAISGCEFGAQKDETACLDIMRQVIPDPSSMRVNHVNRTEGPATLDDLKRVISARFDGKIPPAHQKLLELYQVENLPITQTFIDADITHEGVGNVREKVLCRYLEYEGRKELISFTIRNQDINQDQFFDFFLQRPRPKELDSSYRIN